MLLTIVGAFLGVASIGLGIAGLVTKQWLKVESTVNGMNTPTTVYSLLLCDDEHKCPSNSLFNATKGLEIAGVAALIISIVIGVFFRVAKLNRSLQVFPVIPMLAGPILILIGLLLYAKVVFEDVGTKLLPLGTTSLTTKTTLEYSIILMVVSCIVGFITATIFACPSDKAKAREIQTKTSSFPTAIQF